MAIYYCDEPNMEESLEHHGIIGMKWGVRRYQNPDGSLTPEGRERYYGKTQSDKLSEKIKKASTYVSNAGNGRQSYGTYSRSDFDGSVAKARRMPQMKAVAASVRADWKAVREAKKTMDGIEKSVVTKKTLNELSTKYAEDSWKERRKEYEKYGTTLEDLKDMAHYEDARIFFLAEAYGKSIADTYAFQWWLRRSGDPRVKQYEKAKKDITVSYEKYHKNCVKALNAFLGEHAKDRVDTIYMKDVSLADKAQAIINNIMEAWDGYEDVYRKTDVPINKISRLYL